MAQRRSLVRIHRWLGLGLGLLWALQGATGALLVFHRGADRIGGQALTTAPMAPVSRLIAAGEQRSGRTIDRVTAVGDDLRVLEVRYQDSGGHPRALQVDAATGRIVGRRDRDPASPFGGSAWRWIYILHMSVFAGDVGKFLIGVSGVFLACTLIVGAVLSWPRRKTWRATFSVQRWKTSPQKLYGWHRAAGLASFLPLLLLAITGSYMSFSPVITPLMARCLPFDPVASLAHMAMPGDGAGGSGRITPDEAMAIGRRRFPSGRFMSIELPVEHPAFYTVRFTLPGEWRSWSGRTMIKIDPRNGRIIATYDPLRARWPNRLDDAIYPIHKGEVGGLIGRVLVLLAGVALPMFMATGLIQWRRRVRRATVRNQTPRPERIASSKYTDGSNL